MKPTLALALAITLVAARTPSAVGAAPDDRETPRGSRDGDDTLPRRVDTQHLPNLIQVHADVYSGGLPEGEAAFAELQSLGVKTIVSVDGQPPDVQAADAVGLSYVHLPHGYDGIPAERARQLATAVDSLERPVYVHCHHGRHRSPAAAAVACIGAGLIPAASGDVVLRLAGTSPDYRGLYDAARAARPIDAAELESLGIDFPESVAPPRMVEAMLALERTHERLGQIARSGWRTTVRVGELNPAEHALLLREHYTELLRTEAEQSDQPAAFNSYLRDSEAAAGELYDALRAWAPVSAEEQPPSAFDRRLATITANCTACHQRLRDVPFRER